MTKTKQFILYWIETYPSQINGINYAHFPINKSALNVAIDGLFAYYLLSGQLSPTTDTQPIADAGDLSLLKDRSQGRLQTLDNRLRNRKSQEWIPDDLRWTYNRLFQNVLEYGPFKEKFPNATLRINDRGAPVESYAPKDRLLEELQKIAGSIQPLPYQVNYREIQTDGKTIGYELTLPYASVSLNVFGEDQRKRLSELRSKLPADLQTTVKLNVRTQSSDRNAPKVRILCPDMASYSLKNSMIFLEEYKKMSSRIDLHA